MLDEDLKALWKRAEAGTPALSRGEIEGLLRPTARRTGRTLEHLAWTYLVMLALTALLALVNLSAYRDDRTMLAVQGAIAGVAFLCGVLSAGLLVGLRRIDRPELPLAELVERRLAFTQRRVEPWIWMATVVPWLLSMALNSFIERNEGGFRINHPVGFVLVTVVMFVIAYGSLKFATGSTMRELRALQSDLQAETLDATPRLEAFRRRSRVLLAIAVVLLSSSVLAGLWLWLKSI